MTSPTKLIAYVSNTFTSSSELQDCLIATSDHYFDKAMVMVDAENSEVLVGAGDYTLHLVMFRREENPEFYLAQMAAYMMLSLRSTAIPVDRMVYQTVKENGSYTLYPMGLDGEWLSEENTIGKLITPNI